MAEHYHALRHNVHHGGVTTEVLATVTTLEAAEEAVTKDKAERPGKQDRDGYGPEWDARGCPGCPRQPTGGN
jgi:hypothetical protein